MQQKKILNLSCLAHANLNSMHYVSYADRQCYQVLNFLRLSDKESGKLAIFFVTSSQFLAKEDSGPFTAKCFKIQNVNCRLKHSTEQDWS